MAKQEKLLEVEMDPVGKAAEIYLSKKNKLRESREDLDLAENDLIDKLNEAKRNSIQVDGKTLYVDHIDKTDRIKIRKSLKA